MAKEVKKTEKVKKVKNVKKSDKKGKVEKKKAPKEGFFKGIKKELKLVKWPSVKEIFKYTIATIIFCVVLVAFFEALNIIMAYVKGLFN